MVFKAAWKTDEKLELMKNFMDEKEWAVRATNLAKYFPGRKNYFFTAMSCKKEFERIISEPCPANEPVKGGSAYSQKVLVQQWINHFNAEMAEEERLSSELFLVNIRKKTDILERLDTLTDKEVDELLEIARKEDEESDVNQDVYRVYLKRMEEVYRDKNKEAAAGEAVEENVEQLQATNLLPPTRVSEEQPHGFDTAFCSPSTNSSERMSSPLKSPIRPVAESLAAAVKPERPEEVEDTYMTDDQEEVISTVTDLPENNDEEDSNLFVPVTPIVVRLKSPAYVASQPSTPSSEGKRGRGRPAKVRTTSIAVVSKADSFTEDDIKVETSSISDKDSVDQEKEWLAPRSDPRKEISTGGKISRRPLVDSPLVSQSTRPRRGREEDTSSVDDGEDKKMSEVPKDDAKPSPEVEDSKALVPQTVSTQTDISVQGPLLVHKEEKKDNRRPSVSRKSSRRSDAVEDPTQTKRDYAVQTSRVDLEKDDKLVIRWYDSEEKRFVPRVNLSDPKTEYMSDDDVPLLSLKRGNFPCLDDETESNEKPKKGEPIRSMLLTIDTSDDVAFGLVNQMGYSQTDPTSSSPAKRTRKDDKTKDHSNAQMKQILLTAWNLVLDHRHSTIFAAPVSDREVQGYSEAVKRKTDLSTIKREIESGIIRTPGDFKHRLLLMFANATMFNGTGHDVNTYAREMYADVMPQVTHLLNIKGDSYEVIQPRKTRIADDFVRTIYRTPRAETRSRSRNSKTSASTLERTPAPASRANSRKVSTNISETTPATVSQATSPETSTNVTDNFAVPTSRPTSRKHTTPRANSRKSAANITETSPASPAASSKTSINVVETTPTRAPRGRSVKTSVNVVETTPAASSKTSTDVTPTRAPRGRSVKTSVNVVETTPEDASQLNSSKSTNITPIRAPRGRSVKTFVNVVETTPKDVSQLNSSKSTNITPIRAPRGRSVKTSVNVVETTPEDASQVNSSKSSTNITPARAPRAASQKGSANVMETTPARAPRANSRKTSTNVTENFAVPTPRARSRKTATNITENLAVPTSPATNPKTSTNIMETTPAHAPRAKSRKPCPNSMEKTSADVTPARAPRAASQKGSANVRAKTPVTPSRSNTTSHATSRNTTATPGPR